MALSRAGARALIVVAAAALAVPAVAGNKKAEPSKAAETGKAAADTVAVVDGEPITTADLDARAANQLSQLRAQEYQIRERALDDLIADQLVKKAAAAGGVSVNEYLRAEVDAKAAPVTEEDKKSTFERFKGRLGGMPEEEAMKRIEDGLRQQRTEERRQALLGELRSKASVRVLLDPPRTKVSVAADDPVLGPADAPVTIVEFSDFQCPFCSRAKATVDQVVQRYGKAVRVIFRDFPLPMHREAPKAHEAGQCAAEQGKFWQMHDKMFENQSALQVDALKKTAADLGLDAAKFNECLDSGKHAASVQKDTEEGQSYGVSGTPAFFINGRMISGAQPFENFAKVIDDELQRKGVAVPPPPAPAAAEAKPEAPKGN
jgi:protein-disulfide isomerase